MHCRCCSSSCGRWWWWWRVVVAIAIPASPAALRQPVGSCGEAVAASAPPPPSHRPSNGGGSGVRHWGRCRRRVGFVPPCSTSLRHRRCRFPLSAFALSSVVAYLSTDMATVVTLAFPVGAQSCWFLSARSGLALACVP